MTDLSDDYPDTLETLLGHVDNVRHRCDGPGYLSREGRMDVGVLRLEPGARYMSPVGEMHYFVNNAVPTVTAADRRAVAEVPRLERLDVRTGWPGAR